MAERVMLDTTALYALASATDNYHAKARRTYEDLIDKEGELYTTSHVLVETSALVHHRLGFQPLKALTKSLESLLTVYWVDERTHLEAWKSLIRRDGKGMSLVDWTTLLVARRLKLTIFTFDNDFVREGASTIP